MTIAVALKVNEGVVLGSDSASSMLVMDASGNPKGLINVYVNANKIFNLRKDLPIGAVTWGAGSIGTASISLLAKDLRQRFTDDALHADWHIDPSSYKMEDVAARFREFFFSEHYEPANAAAKIPSTLGFLVAGYSTGQSMAEIYLIEMADGKCEPPTLLQPVGESGGAWYGQPEAISRLLLGFSPAVVTVLEKNFGVAPQDIPKVVAALRQSLQVPMINAAMPLQDAIDLADFLVDLTKKFGRFGAGWSTVDGETELAAITKHEGFKWICRKHYFDPRLNPPMLEVKK